MPITNVLREKIIDGLKEFDYSKRSLKEWQGWDSKLNHKYAI